MGTKCNCRQSECETVDAPRRPAEPSAAAFRLRFKKLRISIFRADLLAVPETAGCIGPTVLPREKRPPRCVRPARQSEDCLRGRPLSGARLFASVRSAKGGDTPRGGTFAVCGWRHSSTPPPLLRLQSGTRHPSANPARRAGSGIPSRHPASPPRGVWRAPAADPLRPRGRDAAILAR